MNNLFFKLNPKNEKHKVIIDFFNGTWQKVSKINTLYRLVMYYKRNN